MSSSAARRRQGVWKRRGQPAGVRSQRGFHRKQDRPVRRNETLRLRARALGRGREAGGAAASTAAPAGLPAALQPPLPGTSARSPAGGAASSHARACPWGRPWEPGPAASVPPAVRGGAWDVSGSPAPPACRPPPPSPAAALPPTPWLKLQPTDSTCRLASGVCAWQKSYKTQVAK